MPIIAITARGLLYLAALIVVLLQIRACPQRWAEPLAWALALIHGLTYAVVYLLDNRDGAVDGLYYNDWARVLWIHFCLVLLGVELARLARLRRGIDQHGC